jgi:PD-(D/E)XK nuclease superfamily protein
VSTPAWLNDTAPGGSESAGPERPAWIPPGLSVFWDVKDKVWRSSQHRWYVLPTPDPDRPGNHDGVGTKWQRATNLAKVGQNSEGLVKWQKHCVLEGVAQDPTIVAGPALFTIIKGLFRDPDLMVQVVQTPVSDAETWSTLLKTVVAQEEMPSTDLGNWSQVEALVEQASDLGGANTSSAIGTLLHDLTDRVHAGESLDDVCTAHPEWAEHLRTYFKVLKANEIEVFTELSERAVVVPQYSIAGKFDRLVLHEGKWRILDLKTGKDPKKQLIEIANQLALYSRAKWMFNFATDAFEELPEIDQDVALVLHLPVAGDITEAGVIPVNIRKAWDDQLPAVKDFADRDNAEYRRSLIASGVGTVTVSYAEAVEEHDAPIITLHNPTPAIEKAEVRKAVRKCGGCGKPGHTKRTCPGPAEEAPETAEQVAPAAEPEPEVPAVEEPVPAPLVPAQRDGKAPTWEERFAAVTTKEEAKELRAEAIAAGIWTAERGPKLLEIGKSALQRGAENI